MKNGMRLSMTLIAVLLLAGVLAACGSAATPAATTAPTAAAATAAPAATEADAAAEVARPSNPGGPGAAIDLTGDVTAGDKVYVDNCQKCHGEKGVGGVENPGSDDGTIPELNPIDGTLISSDAKVYATNLDLFIEHGSKPEGDSPKEVMAAWGDEGKLTPQQIADVIAYIISLNPAK